MILPVLVELDSRDRRGDICVLAVVGLLPFEEEYIRLEVVDVGVDGRGGVELGANDGLEFIRMLNEDYLFDVQIKLTKVTWSKTTKLSVES